MWIIEIYLIVSVSKYLVMNFTNTSCITLEYNTLVRNPSQAKMDHCVPHNDDAAQEYVIKLGNDSGAKDSFARVNLPSF